MLVALYMMSIVAGQQPPPPQAPAFIRADITQLSAVLELEPSQRDSLGLLLADHELKWTKAQGSVIADLRQTPAWAHAQSATVSWKAASAQSLAAHRAVEEVRRRSLTDAAQRQSLARLRLACDAAKRTATNARNAMFNARRAADPGRAMLFGALAARHKALSAELDSSIAALLDKEQRALWPTARRTVRRARRLRALGFAGADIDLRGRVLRRVSTRNEALQTLLDAWTTDTDMLLDRIDALELEAQTAKDDVLAASIFRDSDRLLEVQTDHTLRVAAAMEAVHTDLQGLHRRIQVDAFPLTWGSTDLHMLLMAATRSDDETLLPLAQTAVARYTSAMETEAESWQTIERQGQLSQRMAMRGLSPEAIDTEGIERAGDAARALRRMRDAMVQAQVRVLLTSVSRAQVLDVLPGMPLPPE